jgi:hypothetical protein
MPQVLVRHVRTWPFPGRMRAAPGLPGRVIAKSYMGYSPCKPSRSWNRTDSVPGLRRMSRSRPPAGPGCDNHGVRLGAIFRSAEINREKRP